MMEIQSFEKVIKNFEELKNRELYEAFERDLPFNELITDRWERAKKMGFGEGTSIYNSSLIFGDTIVGFKTWIGPFTIVDGSGGLKIGDNCTISSGVHIYSHDNIKKTLIPESNIERSPVTIGNNTYIGPNTIISKGTTIGSFSIVGANSLVKGEFGDYAIIAGNPASQIGKIEITDQKELKFHYFKKR